MFEYETLETRAREVYKELELDALPEPLRRNSLDYYYLSVYPGMREAEEVSPDTQPNYPDEITTAYVHLPYCTGVCDFCSYFLTTVRQADLSPINQYLDDVTGELDYHGDRTELNIQRVFFGGGTPSLTPPDTLDRFLSGLQRKRFLSRSVMGTVELHPEFFDDMDNANHFIDVLLAHNIGRVSIGYQSADLDTLEETNRRHGTDFLSDSMDFLRARGMLVNIDLMYGLPGLSLKQWGDTLSETIKVNPDSVSTYFLFVDPGTVTHHEVKTGKIFLPSHEIVQTQHIMAQIALESVGFYELPNDFYARLGDGVDPTMFTTDSLPSDTVSLPVGAGAYGFFDRSQLFNHFNLRDYRSSVNNKKSPFWRVHRFDDEGLLRRDVMFTLKNSPYIDRKLFIDKYCVDPVDKFEQLFSFLVAQRLVAMDDESKRITLTPKGRLCVEEIAWLFRSELPDVSQSAPTRERRRLIKHNFAPTYQGRIDV